MIKLKIDYYQGGDQATLTFNSQLEMANWLLDSGYQTKSKTSTGILYYRLSDKACAVWMFKE
jgi:hypothetical protein